MGAEVRLHDPLAFQGRVELRTVNSRALEGNALGDPHVRELPIYVPPGDVGSGLPVCFVLSGFTGRGQSALETHPWRRGLVWQFDRAVAAGETPPMILVLPDCFTKLGGSQYLNSSAVGNYADHVARELVPLVDDHYPTNGRHAVMGKSSGGFGALHFCMDTPGLFQACAFVSGDCGFDQLFPGEFLACLRGLVPHGGDPARFLEAFFERPDLDGDGHAVINTLAMAACYSPNPNSPLGFDLPFDLHNGVLLGEVWQRWLEKDPIHAVTDHAEALRDLELLHLECGLRDEFHLQWGLRRLTRKLEALSVPFHHEEHPGGHRGLDDRFPPIFRRIGELLG